MFILSNNKIRLWCTFPVCGMELATNWGGSKSFGKVVFATDFTVDALW
jgi:hypothetical protein